jgi:alpha-beta hydrolase superfamily lysophospholipase
MQEHATVFGATASLVGIITDPAPGAGRAATCAAIVLNAGVIHRVGPSRLHVTLGRRLAARGWVSVRFDHSGIGDSPSRRDALPFEQSAILEAREVMNAVQQSRGVERFVLIGLCSGAVTALETAAVDSRVVGAVLINPQGFDASAQWNTYVQARSDAKRYVRRSLFQWESWKRVLTGRADYARLFRVLRQQARTVTGPEAAVTTVATRVGSTIRGVLGRGVNLLMLCSEGDEGVDYMNVILGQDIRSMDGGEHLRIRILRGADHSLTLRASQQQVVDGVAEWADLVDRSRTDDAVQPEPLSATAAW